MFVQLFELIVVNSPQKNDASNGDQNNRNGYQHHQHFHQRRILVALNITSVELDAMPSAASQGGIQPRAAMGMAVRLYASAQNRF